MSKNKTHEIVEHLFRHESGKIISHLVRNFGSEQIELIEDAVQHALLRAMQTWSFREIPKNPSGWILLVSRNYMIDQFRQYTKHNNKDIYFKIHSDSKYQIKMDLDNELNDDLLSMMFACCNPKLTMHDQIILSLKIVCGFSNREVGKALLKSEDAIAKAYTRAKLKFKRKVSTLNIPLGPQLNNRLDVILKVLYVLYNEGYNSVSEDELIRKDLCQEAIRLVNLLLENYLLRKPKVHALKALMYFQSSRLKARINTTGELQNLKVQDRKLWDREMIQEGIDHLQLSYAFGYISEYHVEASIAAYHAIAPSFEETDWESIYNGYQLLEKIKPGPVITLNRIVAESMHKGIDAALNSIECSDLEISLKDYYLFYAVKADLSEKKGNLKEAANLYHEAIQKTTNKSERIYLEQKMLYLKKCPTE